MKPKNFPGRKRQRQIEAQIRVDGNRPGMGSWTEEEMRSYELAFHSKSKKNRSGTGKLYG